MSAHNCDGAHGPCPICAHELECEIEARRRRDAEPPDPAPVRLCAVCGTPWSEAPNGLTLSCRRCAVALAMQVVTLTAERDEAILYSENGDLKLRTSAGSTFTLPELGDAATIVDELNRERDYIRRIHESAGHTSLEPLHAVWALKAERDDVTAKWLTLNETWDRTESALDTALARAKRWKALAAKRRQDWRAVRTELRSLQGELLAVHSTAEAQVTTLTAERDKLDAWWNAAEAALVESRAEASTLTAERDEAREREGTWHEAYCKSNSTLKEVRAELRAADAQRDALKVHLARAEHDIISCGRHDDYQPVGECGVKVPPLPDRDYVILTLRAENEALTRRVEALESNDKLCRRCGGRGDKYKDGSGTCETCRGTGRFLDEVKS